MVASLCGLLPLTYSLSLRSSPGPSFSSPCNPSFTDESSKNDAFGKREVIIWGSETEKESQYSYTFSELLLTSCRMSTEEIASLDSTFSSFLFTLVRYLSRAVGMKFPCFCTFLFFRYSPAIDILQ